MTRAWLVLAIAAGMAGCGPRPYVPDRPHPTPAEIDALLRAPVPRKKRAVPLAPQVALRLTPMAAVVGGSMWVRCYTPEFGWLRYGVDGIRVSEGPADRLEHRLLIERIECGRWVAFCLFRAPGGRPQRAEQAFDTLGCSGGVT